MSDFIDRRRFLQHLAANLTLLSCKGIACGRERLPKGHVPGDGTFRTFCKFCPSACGLSITIQNGEITRVAGLVEDPRTNGAICPRAKELPHFLSHPERVRAPLLRTGKKGEGTFKPISWNEALSTLKEEWAAVINEFGPSALMGCLGDRVSLESLWLMPRLFNCLGSPNVLFPSLNLDGSFARAGLATTGSLACLSEENLLKSKCIVLWGCNPTASAPATVLQWIQKAREGGAKLLVVNPYRVPLAEEADCWIPLRPGTDGALALAMARVIIEAKLQDQPFIDKWTDGFRGFAELAFHPAYETAAAAQTCRIRPELIAKAARMYATSGPAQILGGMGVGLHSQGFQTSRALHCLIALTGNINQPGTNLYHSFPVPVMQGPAALEHRRQGSSEKTSKPLANMATGFPDACRLWDLIVADGDDQYWSAQIFRRALSEARHPFIANPVYKAGYQGTAYPVRSLFLLRGDPLSTLPNPLHGKTALSKLEFLVAATHFLTPTARYADLILPLAYHPESTELANTISPNPGKYVLLREQLVPAPPECVSEQELLIRVARVMGFTREFDFSIPQFINHLLASAPETQSVQYEALKHNPLKMLPLFTEEKLFPHARQVSFSTPTGKVMFMSEPVANKGFSPYPEWAPPIEGIERTPELSAQYPLTLITGRWNNGSERPGSWAALNPEDAKTYGIKNGDAILIESKIGGKRFVAEVTENVVPGVVSVSTGAYLHEEILLSPKDGEASWQYLVDDKLNDPIIGAPRTNEMLVRVSRI